MADRILGDKWVTSLGRLSGELSMSLSADEAIRAAVEGAVECTGARQGAFFHVEGDRMVLKYAKGISDLVTEYLDQGGETTDWPVAAAGRAREPVLITTPDELRTRFPASAPMAEASGIQAVANLPAVTGDRVVGVLHLGFGEAHQFSVEERDFLLALSRLVAQAVEQADILERELRIAQKLAEAESVDAVAQLLYAEAMAILRATRVTLRLADLTTGELVLTGKPVGESQVERISLSVTSMSSEAYWSGKPVVVNTGAEYRSRYLDFAASLAVVPEAGLSVPLRFRGNSIGALNLSFSQPRQFADRDVGLAQILADSAAAALERLRLTDLQIKTANRQACIARIARYDLEAETLEALGQKVVDELVAEEGCQACAIFLQYESRPGATLLASFGWPPHVIEQFHATAISSGSVIGSVLTAGEPVFVRDTTEYAERFARQRDTYAAQKLEASGALPLLSQGRTIGALSLAWATVREFDLETRAFLETVAATTAQALERLRARQAENRSRDLLEAVVAQMPVGIRILAPNGAVIASNPLAVTPWRGDRQIKSINDYPAWPTFHMDGRPYRTSERPAVRALGGQTVVDEEVTIRRFDGTTGVLSISAAPVYDDEGRIVAGVVVSSDISERKDRESSRDAFMAVLSHELRTPMTSIGAATRILQTQAESLDRATVAGLYDDIAAETARLQRIIENVLVLSRVEQAMIATDGEPVMLDRFLPRVVAAEQALWPACRFSLTCDERLPVVHGDPNFLEQVMRNLLSNAAKYAPGEVEVRVSRAPDKAEVRISVRDYGAGVATADEEDLFKLFWRSSDQIGKAPGAGVGLFVVRKLVEAMNGRVWLDPSVKDGACFVVALGLVEEAVDGGVEEAVEGAP